MTAQFTENDLVLRVIEGNEAGRLYSVSTEKCLIGLSEGQSQPHLAIFRGPHGTAIQGVGGNIVINGETTESQWLNDGDQIEFANTRLEVIQLGQLVSTVVEASSTEASSTEGNLEPGDIDAFSSRMETLSQRLNNLTCSIDSNATISEQELTSALNQEGEEPFINRGEPTEDETLDSFHEPEADSLPGSFAEAEQSNPQYEVEETIETYSESDDLASRLENAMNISAFENEVPQTDVVEVEPAVETFASTGQAGLEESEEETFVGLEDVLADAEKPVQDEPVETEPEATLGSQAPGVVKNRLRDAFAQHQKEISSEQPATEKDPVMPVNNESVADVLARMQSEGQLEYEMPSEDDASTSTSTLEPLPEPQSYEPPASPTPQPQPSVPAAATDDEEDGSVEDYMNRLLGRMRGGEGSETPKATKKPEKTDNEPSQTFEAPEPKVEVEPVKLLSPEEFKPSMSAPEKTRNLNAMRELANQNNRAALQKANKQRATAVAVTNFSIMGLGFALAIYLLMFSSGFTSSFFLMGAVTMGLSLGLGYLGSKSFMSMMKDS